MGRGRQTDDESREKVCVRLHLSVCLRTRGKEQDRVRESASQRGRERQREGKWYSGREVVTWSSTPLHQAAYGSPAVRSHSMGMGLWDWEKESWEKWERQEGGGELQRRAWGICLDEKGGGWTVSLLAVVDVRRTWRQWLSLRQIVGLLCRSSQREDAMPCEQWGVACVSQEQLLWLHLRCLRVSDRQGMQQTSALSTEAASCTQQGEEPGGLGREWGAPASGRSYLNRHCGPAVILASESRGSPAICWIWTWIYCFQRWEARSLA